MKKYIEVLGKFYESYLLFDLNYIKDEYLLNTRKNRTGNPKNNFYADKINSKVINNFHQLKSLATFLTDDKTTNEAEKIIVKNYFSYANILNSYEIVERKKEKLGKEEELTFDQFKKMLPENTHNKSHFSIDAKLGNAIKKHINIAHWGNGKDFIWEILFSESKLNGYIFESNGNICILWLFNQEKLSDPTKIETVKPVKLIQKIFYGAPGTGKSHKVKDWISDKEERTERVTFHPEYDYSAFVGGYKPTMNGDNIRYEFVPQAFTNIYVKAWNDKDNDYYLVVEEINRGNCAEIFGDIFQLLDRTNDYHITPSKELQEYLTGQFSDNSDIDGNKLILPPNLNILATMNTSDQSLFPMDSAFKRRWDWEYIPINYEESEENKSSKFKIQLSETESFSWLSFIKAVNSVIKQNDNLGMDKCIGNYFIKPEKEEIDIETFINKAIFYLWNDVFKDEMEENNIFLNKTTYEDFFPIQSNGILKLKEILEILKIEITTE